MRILKFLLLLLLICNILSCSAPDPILHDTQGNSIRATQLKGKWLIVNYWATWCPSCLQEIPELNRFYQHNHDKNIILYGVNYDHMPLRDLQLAIAKMQIHYPVLLEDITAIWPLGAIEALPVTFIIAPDGKIAKRIVGGSTEQSLFATVHELQKNA